MCWSNRLEKQTRIAGNNDFPFVTQNYWRGRRQANGFVFKKMKSTIKDLREFVSTVKVSQRCQPISRVGG